MDFFPFSLAPAIPIDVMLSTLLLLSIHAWSWVHNQPPATSSNIGVAFTVVFNTGMVMEA